jgi:hypothetical protein
MSYDAIRTLSGSAGGRDNNSYVWSGLPATRLRSWDTRHAACRMIQRLSQRRRLLRFSARSTVPARRTASSSARIALRSAIG